MFWDCEFCGATKLLGKTHRHCPQCGSAQSPEKRYFPPEEDKVAVQDHVYFGADWKCARCSTPNSNASAFCGNCGAPKDSAQTVGLAHEKPEPEPVPPPAPSSPGASSGGGKGLAGVFGLGCVGGGFLLLILFCAAAIFWTKSESATVSGHRWERTVKIQEYQADADSAWCDQMPADAYDVRKTEKERSTERVPDGEKCETVNVDNGDGTFRQEEECETVYREEPVYSDWCTYTIEQWVDLREASADGDGMTPVWPQTQLNTCAQPRQGCQREGARTESYILQVRDTDGASHTCTVPEAGWRSVQDNEQITISVQMIGGGVTCDI
jgi:hypothetical protein